MRRTTLATGILAALAAGAPAAAIESLTGTYAAKVSCKAIVAGERGKLKFESDLEVSDLGGGQVLLHGTALGDFDGFLLADMARPDGGVLSALACPLNVGNQNGSVLAVDVKTKPGSDDASFKGTLVNLGEGDMRSAVCKITAKRTSTSAPKLVGCPG